MPEARETIGTIAVYSVSGRQICTFKMSHTNHKKILDLATSALLPPNARTEY